MKENQFYSELGNVPALPPELLKRINLSIDHKQRKTRVLWGLAAAALLTLTLVPTFNSKKATGVAEFSDEIQLMYDFFHDKNEVDQDPVTFTLVGDGLF